MAKQPNKRTTISISKEDAAKFRKYMKENKILKVAPAFESLMAGYWEKEHGKN